MFCYNCRYLEKKSGNGAVCLHVCDNVSVIKKTHDPSVDKTLEEKTEDKTVNEIEEQPQRTKGITCTETSGFYKELNQHLLFSEMVKYKKKINDLQLFCQKNICELFYLETYLLYCICLIIVYTYKC